MLDVNRTSSGLDGLSSQQRRERFLNSINDFLARIATALEQARIIFDRFTPGKVATEYKTGTDPVTEADRQLDAALRRALLRDGEGWLSEESVDDPSRLDKEYVWIVDPLDGTREFVTGIPEFCASIGLVKGGQPIAGGICNPATGEFFLGSIEHGLTYNGIPKKASGRNKLEGATVLASRSEVKRGEWRQFEGAPFKITAMGSVAYKLARVAAGLDDATFTLTPKNEWDIAAGIALVLSGGGFARPLHQNHFLFNQHSPLLPGLIACGAGLGQPLTEFLGSREQLQVG
jgi:myo-inositol-1(or 4)-monophosphatase